MTSGLIRAFGKLDVGGLFTCSGSASGGGAFVKCTGEATTFFDPTGFSFGPGIEHLFVSTFPSSGAGSASVTLNIPLFSYSSAVSFGSAQTSIESHVRFTDLNLYVIGGFQWCLTWSAMDWYVNGVVQHSFGSMAFGSLTSARLAPSGIPLLGVPVQLSVGAQPPAVPVPDCTIVINPLGTPVPSGDSGSGSASLTNGWRFQEPGSSAWQAPPIGISTLTPSSIGCSPGIGALSGNDTWSGAVTGSGASSISYVDEGSVTCPCPEGGGVPGIFEQYSQNSTLLTTGATMCLVPNLPKTVKRLNSDFAEMVYRAALPSATQNASASYGNNSGGSGSTSATNTVFPAAAQILSVVGNAAHPLENSLLLPTPVPYSIGGESQTAAKSVFFTTQKQLCAPPPPGPPPDGPGCPGGTCTWCVGSAGSSLTGADGNGGMGYLASETSLAQYVDFLACPLWSCFTWFPQDSDTSAGSSWPLDGAAAPPSQYWLKARTQWLHNALLPSGEERRTRSDIISAPLLEGHLAPFVNSVFGQSTSWWGISRFAVENLMLPGSITLASTETAGWGFGSCTAVFGASITLTPTGSPPAITATYDLGEFGTDPRMLVHLANAFNLGWSGSGISSAQVDLIGADGTVCHLTTAPGACSWPAGAGDAKYAGDWGQDFTVGFAASDSGSDALGAGISSSEMASAEGVAAFRLPFGFTAASLRFTFNLGSPAAVTLDYPTFNFPSTVPYLIHETAFNDAILYANSSGIRFGTWSFYSSGWLSTPAIRAFGSKSTVLDYLGWANLLYRGLDSQTNVLTTLASLYDGNEGQTELLASLGTTAFLTMAAGSLTGITDNTFREVPPLCCFPMPSRATNLQPAAGYDTLAYSATQEGRYYPTAGSSPLVLTDPGGVVWTAAQPAPAGWALSRHSHPVANTENSGFLVKLGGVTYAHASPWHGYFSVLFPGGCVSPDTFQSHAGELHIVCIKGSDLRYQWSPFPTGPIAFDVAVTGDGGWSEPSIHIDHRGRAELRATQGGHVFRMVSDDNGRTWGPVSGGVLTPELVI